MDDITVHGSDPLVAEVVRRLSTGWAGERLHEVGVERIGERLRFGFIDAVTGQEGMLELCARSADSADQNLEDWAAVVVAHFFEELDASDD